MQYGCSKSAMFTAFEAVQGSKSAIGSAFEAVQWSNSTRLRLVQHSAELLHFVLPDFKFRNNRTRWLSASNWMLHPFPETLSRSYVNNKPREKDICPLQRSRTNLLHQGPKYLQVNCSFTLFRCWKCNMSWLSYNAQLNGHIEKSDKILEMVRVDCFVWNLLELEIVENQRNSGMLIKQKV